MALKLILLALMAITHLFASRLRFLQGIPRSIWLSVGGGASVSYVFLHLIPELVEASKSVNIIEHDLLIYFIALIGLCFMYGMEKVAKENESKENTFWVHMISYGFYNFIIGYLLLSQYEISWEPVLLYFIAMSFHFIVNDYGLLEHHKEKYIHIGRWIVAAAILLGGTTAVFLSVSNNWIHGGLAFISGGVIMNVLKEELPENRKSRFWAFLLGVALYSFLLILLTIYE